MPWTEPTSYDRFVDENDSITVIGKQGWNREVAIKFWDRPGLYQYNRFERYAVLKEDYTTLPPLDEEGNELVSYKGTIEKVSHPRFGWIEITVWVYYKKSGELNRIKVVSERFTRTEMF
jgi:hypothetical protein